MLSSVNVTVVERLAGEVENLSRKTSECKEKYESAKSAKVAKEAQMVSCSKEIKALLVDKAQFEKAAEAASLKSREVKHKLEQWDKNAKDAKKRMDELVESHSWISREKKFFGLKDSDFDFEAKDVEECKKRLKSLKSDQEKLSKKINKKVIPLTMCPLILSFYYQSCISSIYRPFSRFISFNIYWHTRPYH